MAAWREPCSTRERRASPSAGERPPCGWNRTMSTSWPGAPTVTHRKPPFDYVDSNLEVEGVAVEAESGVGVLDRDEHCGDGNWHAAAYEYRPLDCFSDPARFRAGRSRAVGDPSDRGGRPLRSGWRTCSRRMGRPRDRGGRGHGTATGSRPRPR